MTRIYTKEGGHMDKLHSVFMPHSQILIRLGNAKKYSYQSIYRFDEHVRSRESGQGPNLSWSFDHATSHIFLEPFVAKEPKDRKMAVKGKSNGKAQATELVCHKWAAGGKCTFPNCKFSHQCKPCGVKNQQKHDLAACKGGIVVPAKST